MTALWKRWLQARAPEAARAPAAGGAADIPIRSAAEDLLSRTVLAGRIAEMLAAPGAREGRVFAIRGSWGEGKSSLQNLVIEALAKHDPAPPYLEFNPWQWGDSDAIARALFEQMASRLGGAYAPDAVKRAKALRRYGALLAGGGGSLVKADDKGVSGWLLAAALVLASIGIGVPDLPAKSIAAAVLGLGGVALLGGKLLGWLGRDRSGAPLEDLRADLETRLKQLDLPLVIFVDDIDRLEAEQIRMLFRQIKVNANLPNILFLLLFQPSIVELALEPVAGTEGREYLEKIVQAHFDLPPVAPERLMQIFAVQLSLQVGDLAVEANGFEQRRWGNVALGGIQPFIRNLRDMRRLLSSVEIHMPLHKGPRVFEVNIIDFVALEALRVFEPAFHAALAREEKLLLQSMRFRQDGREKPERETIVKLVEMVPEGRRDGCKMLVIELFPQVAWVFGGTTYSGDDWMQTWLREKRVCTPRHFHRYFQLQLPDGAISESDFADLVEAAGDAGRLAAVVEGYRARQALPALAARFDESVGELPLGDIERLMPVILELGEELSSEPGADGPFNTPFISAWRAASWFLRRVPEPKERARILLEAMRATQTLSTPAILISLDLDSDEKKDEEDDRERDPAFDPEDLEPLKKAWIANMTERTESDPDLLGHDRLVGHLYRWRDFSGSFDAPRAWVDAIGQDPARRVQLLVRFMSVGQQSGWGDRVSTKVESFRKDTLEEFFDLDKLRIWLKRLDRDTLGEEERRVLGILDWHLDKWSRGESTRDR